MKAPVGVVCRCPNTFVHIVYIKNIKQFGRFVINVKPSACVQRLITARVSKPGLTARVVNHRHVCVNCGCILAL